MGLGYDAVLQANTHYKSFHFCRLDLLAVFGTLRIHYILSVKHTHTIHIISYRIEIYIYMARKYIYIYVCICFYINIVYVVKCI